MKWVSKRAKKIKGGESLVAMAPSLRQVTSGFGRVVAAGGGPGPVHPRVQAEKSIRGITYKPGLYVFHGHEMFPPHDQDSNRLATDAFWMDRRQQNYGAYAFRSHHIKFAFTSERMADTERRLEGGMALDLLNRMLST